MKIKTCLLLQRNNNSFLMKCKVKASQGCFEREISNYLLCLRSKADRFVCVPAVCLQRVLPLLITTLVLCTVDAMFAALIPA